MTKQDLKNKYGEITFLFKDGDTPYTEIKNPQGESVPAGQLIEKEGKIQCYECGKWFKLLGGSHLKFVHNMEVKDYKEKYGFQKTSGLCSRELSQLHSRISTELKTGIKGMKYLKKFHYNLGVGGRGSSIQTKNKTNTCDAQREERLRLLVAKFGKKIKVSEANSVDCGVLNWAQKKFGSWNKMKKHFSLETRKQHGDNRKKDADMIYDLREYIKKFGNLPYGRLNHKFTIFNNFSHAPTSYVNHFGSLRKAWIHCGIKKYSYRKWGVIN